jgi:2-polyprenyl-3-methyl-5-hydroxy-6-metoxy-1,4-benzoquinol methylase
VAETPARQTLAPVARDDFDAALQPGFREATRGAYAALDRAWDETWLGVLTPQGEFRPGTALARDCPVCRAPVAGARVRFAKLGMTIATCASCGMTYSREALRADLDRRLYLESAAQARYVDLKANQSYAALERVKCRYLVQELGRWRAPPGRLLDVGAGGGKLLEAALAAGWRAEGIEVNAEFAGACRAAGLEVREGFFPECEPAQAAYEALVLLDVLEHALEPAALLGALRARLAPGGVLLVQVPNFDSLLVRAEGAASSTFCHGHWNHFNAASLARLCAAAGLRPLRLETVVSELDRIAAQPAPAVEAALRELTGGPPPAALSAGWLHERLLGYKLLGYFSPVG